MKDPTKVACRIFVGNLPTDDMERQDLKELFSKYGPVSGMWALEKLILAYTDYFISALILGVLLNRGFGFVQFENEASAAEAIKNSNSITFNGKKVGK